MNGFALRLVLTQRQKATRKRPIAQYVIENHSINFAFHYIDRLFEIAPEMTDLFPFGDDFTKPQFTTHALNIMNALDHAIQNLDNPDVLIPKLRELGQMHAGFELTVKEFQVRLFLQHRPSSLMLQCVASILHYLYKISDVLFRTFYFRTLFISFRTNFGHCDDT